VPRLLFSLLPLVLTWMPAEAQATPGTNLSVRLDVVSLTRVGDTCQVSYIAHNSSTSQEPLWAVTVEAPAAPLAISKPTPAEAWVAYTRYGDRPVANWASLDGSIAEPGATSPTLSFKAVGLPAIVDAHIEGYYDPPDVDSLGSDSALGVDALESHSVPVKAVGVEPIATGATLASLTNRLTTLTNESCNLAWISSGAVCASLSSKLQQAHQAFSQRNNKRGRNQLQSFLSELSAQHDAQSSLPVKNNAFWLLKVNAEFVLGLKGR
jgi:hypothetical protein